MSKVFFTPQFINDIKKIENPSVLTNLFKKIFDNKGNFIEDTSDKHHWDAKEDAWEKKISRGDRIIYFKKNENIYLWRIGEHEIVDKSNNKKVLLNEDLSIIDMAPTLEVNQSSNIDKIINNYKGEVLYSKNEKSFSTLILSLNRTKLNRVILIAPFISQAMFTVHNPLGGLLYKQIEENNAEVILVTQPPKPNTLHFFEMLASRNINCFFLKKLHSKVFCFDIDTAKSDKAFVNNAILSIIGSANLTESAINFKKSEQTNEEIGYNMSNVDSGTILTYAFKLKNISNAIDYYRIRYKDFVNDKL